MLYHISLCLLLLAVSHSRLIIGSHSILDGDGMDPAHGAVAKSSKLEIYFDFPTSIGNQKRFIPLNHQIISLSSPSLLFINMKALQSSIYDRRYSSVPISNAAFSDYFKCFSQTHPFISSDSARKHLLSTSQSIDLPFSHSHTRSTSYFISVINHASWKYASSFVASNQLYLSSTYSLNSLRLSTSWNFLSTSTQRQFITSSTSTQRQSSASSLKSTRSSIFQSNPMLSSHQIYIQSVPIVKSLAPSIEPTFQPTSSIPIPIVMSVIQELQGLDLDSFSGDIAAQNVFKLTVLTVLGLDTSQLESVIIDNLYQKSVSVRKLRERQLAASVIIIVEYHISIADAQKYGFTSHSNALSTLTSSLISSISSSLFTSTLQSNAISSSNSLMSLVTASSTPIIFSTLSPVISPSLSPTKHSVSVSEANFNSSYLYLLLLIAVPGLGAITYAAYVSIRFKSDKLPNIDAVIHVVENFEDKSAACSSAKLGINDSNSKLNSINIQNKEINSMGSEMDDSVIYDESELLRYQEIFTLLRSKLLASFQTSMTLRGQLGIETSESFNSSLITSILETGEVSSSNHSLSIIESLLERLNSYNERLELQLRDRQVISKSAKSIDESQNDLKTDQFSYDNNNNNDDNDDSGIDLLEINNNNPPALCSSPDQSIEVNKSLQLESVTAPSDLQGRFNLVREDIFASFQKAMTIRDLLDMEASDSFNESIINKLLSMDRLTELNESNMNYFNSLSDRLNVYKNQLSDVLISRQLQLKAAAVTKAPANMLDHRSQSFNVRGKTSEGDHMARNHLADSNNYYNNDSSTPNTIRFTAAKSTSLKASSAGTVFTSPMKPAGPSLTQLVDIIIVDLGLDRGKPIAEVIREASITLGISEQCELYSNYRDKAILILKYLGRDQDAHLLSHEQVGHAASTDASDKAYTELLQYLIMPKAFDVDTDSYSTLLTNNTERIGTSEGQKTIIVRDKRRRHAASPQSTSKNTTTKVFNSPLSPSINDNKAPKSSFSLSQTSSTSTSRPSLIKSSSLLSQSPGTRLGADFESPDLNRYKNSVQAKDKLYGNSNNDIRSKK